MTTNWAKIQDLLGLTSNATEKLGAGRILKECDIMPTSKKNAYTQSTLYIAISKTSSNDKTFIDMKLIICDYIPCKHMCMIHDYHIRYVYISSIKALSI